MSAGSRVPEAPWRPVAFFVSMLGFGLRLDTSWQGLGMFLIVGGAVAGAVALRPLLSRSSSAAFVPPETRR